MDLDVVPGDLLAEEQDFLASLDWGSVVRILDDGEIGVCLAILEDAGDYRGEWDEAVGELEEHLEAQPHLVQVDGAVLVVEALLEGVDTDLFPVVQGGGGVLLLDTLDPQVLEAVRHVRLRDLHRAHTLLAQT